MNILGVQIIGILFSIFMVYVSFLNWKKKDLNNLEMLFWIFLWTCFIIIILFPNILQGLTKILFFARTMDLLMIAAFIILTIIGYSNYISNKKIEKKIEKMVRNQAIKKYLKNK
ncbi:hypothetical protein COT44_00905 [Candidatus Shapirobacteria bacterium CG08_land_8_20_14_0_20_39_18]|uniref:DUF2304 domain-containing protein n=1 Tax=Candidatus Shapirobacteria bacterium CG08_land_8_20_14_0_20_39_18 TaxID=1974883 RepID=A0A2M6XDT7_9BACT|nr:MAG: hypothetical protein COT44_00905 [Candidatus Shapirobacteria bacterium CG08_land_8_20_14_0_20_39_18]PJE68609.1 MAG: hypothetical protein COU94_00980 [Candidatus Shapirobacteria bacterium CG10_big_fil_rev_8_21_14_0_10_38_8]